MLLAKIFRYYNTIKYLKIKQIIWRFLNLFPRFDLKYNSHPTINNINLDFITKNNITHNYKTFNFLNYIGITILFGLSKTF